MAQFLKVDVSDIKKLENTLDFFNKRGVGYANRWTINTGVRETQKEARSLIKDKYILRNQWTKKSIQFEPSKSPQKGKQAAYVGSVVSYMADQEYGGVKRPKKGKHVALPTSYSAGQSIKSKPRKRVPRKPNKLQNLKLQTEKIVMKGANQSAKRKSVVAVRMALRKKWKYIYLDLPWKKGKRGLFRVLQRPSQGSNLKMVHSLREKVITVKQDKWLDPAVDKVMPRMPGVYIKALEDQIERARVARGLK